MTADRATAPSTPTRVPDRGSLAVTGLAALVLSATLWVEAPEPPEPGAPAARIRSYLEANLDQIGLASMAATIGFGAFILLVVALWRLVAARGGSQSFAAVLLLVSGGLSSLWIGFAAAVDLVPVVATDDNGKLSGYSDQTLLTLDLVQRLNETFGDVSTVSRGLFLASAGLLVVRHRVLPRWTGHLALVVGTASLLGVIGSSIGGPLTVAWFVGLFGFALWILVIGVASVVLLLLSRRRQRSLQM